MRYELKYLCPVEILPELRNTLMPFLELDKFSESRPQREYTIRSAYLDSLKMEAYHEKEDGLKIRKKLRIRTYNELSEKSIAFLEIKRKNEQFISKNRALFRFNDLDTLLDTGDIETYLLKKDTESYRDASRFLFHMNKSFMRPIINIVYEREAFFSKFDPGIRITFDKKVRSSVFRTFVDLFDESRMKEILFGKFVLELKFQKRFSPSLQKMISRFNLTRMSVSKYVISIESDPALYLHTTNRKLMFNNPLWMDNYQKEAI